MIARAFFGSNIDSSSSSVRIPSLLRSNALKPIASYLAAGSL